MYVGDQITMIQGAQPMTTTSTTGGYERRSKPGKHSN